MLWPPPREPLAGSIVRLEPLDPAHEPGLLDASRDPEIWTWIDRSVGEREDAFHGWFAERLATSAAGADWCFATISVATGEPIGSSSYINVRPEHNGVEIGWTWLRTSAWRTGANREAKLLMLQHAFEDLGCMRVEFKTDARNRRSRDALGALPAVFEGIFRRHMLVPGVGVRDSAYFSIVDEEWPAVKERLRASCGRPADSGPVGQPS